MSGALYSTRNVCFDYLLDTQKIRALEHVSLDIAQGSLICLTGPSGSGKTTLLNLLGLIEPVQEGEVHFQGKSLRGLGEAELNELRRFRIGFIFQQFQLFPVLRADENVEYFLARQKLAPDEREKRVREALEAVGLWQHRGKRPLEMSGGQRQRVAIARAIAKKPQVIIADEPTASLDQATGKSIMELIKDLNRSMGVSVILSSHDPMVLQFTDQQIRLVDGQVVGRSTC